MSLPASAQHGCSKHWVWGSRGVTQSYWVAKGWNHLGQARGCSGHSPVRSSGLGPGEEKNGEQEKTRKGRDPERGPRKPFCRDLRFLLIHKKLGAFPKEGRN